MTPRTHRWLSARYALTAGVFLAGAHAARAEDDLFELSLEELMEIDIASVSKKNESLRDVAAAAHVITAEDIQRSGVRTLPDALRLAPGVEVAQINGGSWAISIRGFNGRFANKLLILLDGRSIYNPIYSGVYWENQQILVEDIERIEVIRGPGAAVWGSNAMNGVINIITRTARDAEGVEVVGEVSNEGDWRVGGSVGHVISDTLAVKTTITSQISPEYRVASFENIAPGADSDQYHSTQFSVRMDASPSENDELSVIARAFTGERNELFYIQAPDDEPTPAGNDTGDLESWSVQALWSRHITDTLQFEAAGSYEELSREEFQALFEINSTDLSAELHWASDKGHAISGGLYYEEDGTFVRDGGPIELVPATRTTRNYGAFIHTEWPVFDDKTRLIIGSTMEDNAYTGFEYQPTIRIARRVTDTQRAWAGVSRSVRTPNRIDTDTRFLADFIPAGTPENPSSLPRIILVDGDENKPAEIQTAFEIGYRFSPTSRSSFDISTFYNDYDDILAAEPTEPRIGDFRGVTGIIIAIQPVNPVDARSYGGEIAARWAPLERFRLDASYTYLDLEFEVADGFVNADNAVGIAQTPQHQALLASYLTLTPTLQLDTRLSFRSSTTSDSTRLSGTYDLSGRLGWRPDERFELSLIGEQINDESQVELMEPVSTVPVYEIERRVFARLKVFL